MPVAPDTYITLSAMITPALFMTASGSLIISTSNRMSRVVDRVRQLNLEADVLCRGATELDFVDDRLDHAIGSARSDDGAQRPDPPRADLALPGDGDVRRHESDDGPGRAAGNSLEAVPTTMAIVGVSLMLAACVQLTREARVALRNNRIEILFYQKLRDRRGCPPAPEGPTPGG